MSQLIANQQKGKVGPTNAASQDMTWYLYMALPAMAIAVDLFTPQLVAWRLLPGQIRWISDAAVAGMLVVTLIRMLLTDRIPRAFLVIVAVSIVGVTIALFEGQGIAATAYGWWRMFMYPMVALYAYMAPSWPKDFPKWLMRGSLVILGFETSFQIIQFLAGAAPNDFLAGTFGPHGVGPLIMFIILVVCFGLGIWLVRNDVRFLLLALLFGAISSMLGEMKLFPVAVIMLASLALVIQTLNGGSMRKLLVFFVILILAVSGFVFIFNTVTASTSGSGRTLQDYFDIQVLDRYLSTIYTPSATSYNLGRNVDVTYAWDQIQFDTVRVLAGRGIGSRTNSAALGLVGQALRDSYYGSWTGRSLSMFIQETGILGVVLVFGFAMVTSIALYKKAWRTSDDAVAALQLGLMLFSSLWLLWLWYQPIWLQAVPMLLYWLALGYAFSDSAKVIAES